MKWLIGALWAYAAWCLAQWILKDGGDRWT